MWTSSWLPNLVAHVFAKLPPEPIWEWAESNVFLGAKAAAESGYYKSSKTPWTRRLQEIARTGRDPRTGHRVNQISVKKSSVAGYTEACLNVIRWRACFKPCNVIYSIDSRDEAATINELRLKPTLEQLGEQIFTADEDDVSKYMLKLRSMIVWFFGSYSSGKYANKQAPLCIGDELEEHGHTVGDTSTVNNLRSRMKSAGEDGLLILLSKPKRKNGPIDKEHKDGNQEIYLVPCPHCETYQPLLWTRVRFHHCKDLTGTWDRQRVLKETYYECVSSEKCRIEESAKAAMIERGQWLATNPHATPGHISQHMSDLYSLNENVSWGRLALTCIKNDETGTLSDKQGFWNHNLGLEWTEEENKLESKDIYKLRQPYRRGTIPFEPVAILLGSDVGLDYAKWVVGALSLSGKIAVIDWGTELHPDGVSMVVNSAEYLCVPTGQKLQIGLGYMDGKYRKEEVYKTCLHSGQRLWPIAGGGGRFARQSIAFGQIPTFPRWFGLTSFNDRDFKHELYNERLKGLKPPEIIFPEAIDDELVTELTNEKLVEVRPGFFDWIRMGPNHFGDCVKIICVGWKWCTRDQRAEVPGTAPSLDTAQTV